MDKKSIEKVMKAGFVIIRKEDTFQPRIKIKTLEHDWRTLEKFDTKSARNRHFDKLMEEDKYLDD